MLKFNDWCKKDKEYTLTKSSSGFPLFVQDNPFDKDDEPVLYWFSVNWNFPCFE